MNLASAYPNSALPAAEMAVIALVMLASLGFWIIMVFLADRDGGGRRARRRARPAGHEPAPLAGGGEVAEDEQSEATSAPAGQRHEAAA